MGIKVVLKFVYKWKHPFFKSNFHAIIYKFFFFLQLNELNSYCK